MAGELRRVLARLGFAVFVSLAAYALSRVRLPGRDLLLYVLLLFSSVVSGTAAWCRCSCWCSSSG